MATYRPSFVDVSGLTAGISSGLQMAAQLKRQEDQLAEARVDDFMKMYQPGKLRQLDIPEFTNAYSNYKNAALTFSKINRGGGKPEDLAAAKAQMDNALAGLNDVYNKSTSAASKQAEYADYLKTARQKGYEIPNEVTTYVNALSTSPVSKLEVDKIPSAYQFDLVPKQIDWDGLSKTLDNAGARLKDITTERQRIQYGVDVTGKPTFAEAVTKFSGRDPRLAVDIITKLGASNPKIANSAKEDYSLLVQGIQSGAPASLERFNEIREYFPNVQSVKDVTPEMVFGLPLYRKQSQGTTIDKSMAEEQYKLAKDVTSIGLQKQKIAAQLKGKETKEGAQYHPSVVINSVVENIQPKKVDVGQKGMVGLQPVDVSNEFAGFEMKSTLGYSVPIAKVDYVAGAGNVQPYFRVTLRDGSEEVLQPKALNSRIVSAMPDINFKTGAEDIIEKASKKKQATKQNKGLGTLELNL